MKKLTMGLLLCASMSGAQANDFSTIIDNVYETEDIVREYRRKINRRPKLAKKVNDVLEKAKTQVQALLTKRGGGQGGVDLKLVEVTQNACANLGTWNGRKDCFKNYLSGTRGLLGSVNNACSSIKQDQAASNCYNKGLKSIQTGERTKSKVSNASCSQLSYWDARKSCFNGYFRDSSSDNSQITFAACSTLSQDQAGANCFTRATSLQSSAQPKDILLKACSILSYWDARAKCFQSGVTKASELGYGLKRYTRGCFSTNGDQARSQCFERSLRSL